MKKAKLTKYYNNLFEKMVFDLKEEYEELSISYKDNNITIKEYSKEIDKFDKKYRRKSLTLLDRIDSTKKRLKKSKIELEHSEFQMENILIDSDGDSQITFGIRFVRPTNLTHKYFFDLQNDHFKDCKYYFDLAIDLIRKELVSLNNLIYGIIEFENALFGGIIPYIPKTIAQKYPDLQLEEYCRDIYR